MDKLVKRVTAVPRGDGGTVTIIYRDNRKEGKTSELLKPVEKTVRRLMKAEAIRSNETLRLHEESKKHGRDDWVFDAPGNALKAGRKAYNEARKVVPYRILPKA